MPKKILLIDDEEDLVTMLGFRLEASGLRVVGASGGREGIEKAKKEKPDLILLDLMMPNMDGFEVAVRLSEDSSTKSIPIVIFTAAVSPELAEKIRQTHAVGYLTKPFEPEVLIAKVKKVLLGESGETHGKTE